MADNDSIEIENANKTLRTWLDPNKVRPINAPREFYRDLARILARYILEDVGEVHESKLKELSNTLYYTTQLIAAFEDRLALGRESEQPLRELRIKSGRARREVCNSRESLLLAKDLLQDQMSELKQGWLRFDRPLRDLERIEEKLGDLEYTSAALIHPQQRTAKERELATKSPYKLNHPELRISEGSADLQYLAVELVDDQLQKFTGGKSAHANNFISEFLRISLGWNVTPSNVKTMRNRIRRKKILESDTATASNTPTSLR